MNKKNIYSAWRVDLDFNPIDDEVRTFIGINQNNVIKLLATEAGVELSKCSKCFVPLGDEVKWFVRHLKIVE